MKKVLVIALAVVMTLAVVAFAACATEQTVTGKCHYTTQWGAYGCMVDVTEGQLGYAKTEAAYATWIEDTFVGKTVAEVNAYVASATAEGQSVKTEGINLAGATQSAARVIVAVKDALSKLAK